MLSIFGAAESGGIFTNGLFDILVVVAAVFIFLKFCSWSKKFTLAGGLKKWIYILTGVGCVVFNIMYSQGNAMVSKTGNWQQASVALVASLVWVFIFAFALMAETKTE